MTFEIFKRGNLQNLSQSIVSCLIYLHGQWTVAICIFLADQPSSLVGQLIRMEINSKRSFNSIRNNVNSKKVKVSFEFQLEF